MVVALLLWNNTCKFRMIFFVNIFSHSIFCHFYVPFVLSIFCQKRFRNISLTCVALLWNPGTKFEDFPNSLIPTVYTYTLRDTFDRFPIVGTKVATSFFFGVPHPKLIKKTWSKRA